MRIAITGAGIVSAVGVGKEATLEALREERSGIERVRLLRTQTGLPVGEVKMTNEELQDALGLQRSETLSRTSLLGLVAAREALQQAGVAPTKDMAFLNGTTVGGMDLTEQVWHDMDEHTEVVRLHSAGSSTDRMAEQLGEFGFVTTLSTACSSALNAIIVGANMLRAGKVKRVLVGGTESLTLFHLNGFRALQILDTEPCRPFCGTRNGLNLGEGAAYLVMEAEDDALARGAEVLGYVAGYGNRCDAYHQTASSEDGEGSYEAMRQAIEMAGIRAEQIDYVNAHGTATPNNDSSETTAMQRLFGERIPAVSSTKAFTGHTTSASGSIETVICLLAMQHGFVPAQLNWREKMEGGIEPVLHTTEKELKYVLCNSFGFGGNDSSLVLSSRNTFGAEMVSPRNERRKGLNEGLSEEKTLLRRYEVDVPLTVDWKPYIAPMQARRLTAALRCLLVAARQAMEQSGVEKPDAILTGTDWGCIHYSVELLNQLVQEGEDGLSPTLFMQSTHNTPSSLVAIQTKNHGYNATYSHGKQSFEHALLDAETQIALGMIGTALVLGFEEDDERWHELTDKAGIEYEYRAKAVMIC